MGILAFMLASNHVVKDFVPFLGEHLPSAGGTIKEHADKRQGAEGLSERFHLSSQIGRHIFTCQNVHTLPCLDWLWCGLQFHVEHHMFPREHPRGRPEEQAVGGEVGLRIWRSVRLCRRGGNPEKAPKCTARARGISQSSQIPGFLAGGRGHCLPARRSGGPQRGRSACRHRPELTHAVRTCPAEDDRRITISSLSRQVRTTTPDCSPG